ncbi:hypothetical protein FACS189472_12180 [Alphaproteobacteria bacterium]|nr:hypothetical protein FACS189472_12180 [Alphaproteobacteria bacterium]
MSKIKVIAALGLCGAMMSPSLEAINYNVENGFSGMKRDTILRLCGVMWDRTANIRTVIGSCDEHFQWKDHSYFVESRKRRLADNIVNPGRALYPIVQSKMNLELRIGTIDDVMHLLDKVYLHFRRSHIQPKDIRKNMYSPDLSRIIVPLVETAFRIGRLHEPEHFLEDAIQVAMNRFRGWSREEEADSALGLMYFFLDHKVVSNYALFSLWATAANNDIAARPGITLKLKALHADINDYTCCARYRVADYTNTLLDHMYCAKNVLELGIPRFDPETTVEAITKNISFLENECGAKKFEDLLPEVQVRARKENEATKNREGAQ